MSRKFIDIGVNLMDSMYQGIYHGKKYHDPDLIQVLDRAWKGGLDKMIITAGSLSEAREAAKFVSSNSKVYEDKLYTTVGVHPTRSNELINGQNEEKLNIESYMEQLRYVISKNPSSIIAIGELGLDYDRLNFCDKETQWASATKQLELAQETKLPVFLHNRGTNGDFVKWMKQNRQRFTRGVVHSFDGGIEEALQLIDMDLYIGLNGCSLKTPDNLETVKALPIDRIMIETDAPWCSISASSAGSSFIRTKFSTKKKEKTTPLDGLHVKGRCEPDMIIQVAEVIAGVKGIEVPSPEFDEFLHIVKSNTEKVFFPQN